MISSFLGISYVVSEVTSGNPDQLAVGGPCTSRSLHVPCISTSMPSLYCKGGKSDRTCLIEGAVGATLANVDQSASTHLLNVITTFHAVIFLRLRIGTCKHACLGVCCDGLKGVQRAHVDLTPLVHVAEFSRRPYA